MIGLISASGCAQRKLLDKVRAVAQERPLADLEALRAEKAIKVATEKAEIAEQLGTPSVSLQCAHVFKLLPSVRVRTAS